MYTLHTLLLALSEPESLALHNHIQSIRPALLSAISIHAYGKDIYYPKVCVQVCDWSILADGHINQ